LRELAVIILVRGVSRGGPPSVARDPVGRARPGPHLFYPAFAARRFLATVLPGATRASWLGRCRAPLRPSPERGFVELTGATCAWGHPASKTSKNRW